jgi:hypothetical protein
MPFVTLPVTVEDGSGAEDVGRKEGDGDEEDVSLGEGPGVEAGLEAGADVTGDVPAAAELCDEWPCPIATTAPAVPPATSTHPTANAATVARLRPAPGKPTPANVQAPLKATRYRRESDLPSRESVRKTSNEVTVRRRSVNGAPTAPDLPGSTDRRPGGAAGAGPRLRPRRPPAMVGT